MAAPMSCFLHPRQIRRGQDQALQLTHQPTRHQGGNRSPRSTARLSSRGQTRSRQKANPLSTRCARSRAKRADPSNGQRRGNSRGVLRGLDHCVRLRQPLELLSRWLPNMGTRFISRSSWTLQKRFYLSNKHRIRESRQQL